MCTCVFSDNTYTQKNFVVIIRSDQYCENVIKNLDFFSALVCSVDENWSGLTQALSGQFCASLNFIDSKTTTSPKLSFTREGVTSTAGTNSSLLRHAALPRELVCTENLTPWKKLLPCDSKVLSCDVIFVPCDFF